MSAAAVLISFLFSEKSFKIPMQVKLSWLLSTSYPQKIHSRKFFRIHIKILSYILFLFVSLRLTQNLVIFESKKYSITFLFALREEKDHFLNIKTVILKFFISKNIYSSCFYMDFSMFIALYCFCSMFSQFSLLCMWKLRGA